MLHIRCNFNTVQQALPVRLLVVVVFDNSLHMFRSQPLLIIVLLLLLLLVLLQSLLGPSILPAKSRPNQ